MGWILHYGNCCYSGRPAVPTGCDLFPDYELYDPRHWGGGTQYCPPTGNQEEWVLQNLSGYGIPYNRFPGGRIPWNKCCCCGPPGCHAVTCKNLQCRDNTEPPWDGTLSYVDVLETTCYCYGGEDLMGGFSLIGMDCHNRGCSPRSTSSTDPCVYYYVWAGWTSCPQIPEWPGDDPDPYGGKFCVCCSDLYRCSYENDDKERIWREESGWFMTLYAFCWYAYSLDDGTPVSGMTAAHSSLGGQCDEYDWYDFDTLQIDNGRFTTGDKILSIDLQSQLENHNQPVCGCGVQFQINQQDVLGFP